MVRITDIDLLPGSSVDPLPLNIGVTRAGFQFFDNFPRANDKLNKCFERGAMIGADIFRNLLFILKKSLLLFICNLEAGAKHH